VLEFILAMAMSSGTGVPGDGRDGIREISCSAIDSYSGHSINLGGYSVMRETLADGPLSLQFSGDFEINALTCRRSSSVPQPNDYKVAMAGLILFIESRRRGENVRTALYVEDDQFVLRILEGRLTNSERELTLDRIRGYYDIVNANPTETAPNDEDSSGADMPASALSGPDSSYLCDRPGSRDGSPRGDTRRQSCRTTSRRMALDPSRYSHRPADWF
jgi:hypothetical protein